MKKNIYFKLIKNYSWRSSFFNYFLFITTMFVIVVAVLLVFVRKANDNSVNKAIDNSINRSFYGVSSMVEQVFGEINKNYNEFVSDSEFDMFLCSDSINEFDSSQINKMISNCVNTTDYLDSIYVYGKKSDYILSTKSSSYFNNFYNISWYETFEIANKWFYVMPTESIDNPRLISCIYNMSLEGTDVSDGVFVANIDVAKLEKIMFNSNDFSYENLYLINDEGIIIYANDKSIIGNNIDGNMVLNNIFKRLDGDIFLKRDNNSIVCGTLFDNGIRMVLESDLKYYSVDTSHENRIFMSAMLLSIFVALLLSLYSSMKFYKTIVSLISKLEDPMQEYDNKQKESEISYITNSILSVVKNNKVIENELLEKINMLKKSQSIALQTQLNPHFLFNTLNLINVIVMRITRGENEASKVIKILCELLDVALDTEKYIVTVRDEIEYTKKYIEIEKIKSKDAFDVIWNINEEFLDAKMIKFVLQPIVENSVEHGFKKLKKERGKLQINMEVEGDKLIFVVKDNGCGIPDEKLIDVNNRLQTEDIVETKNIGISNVNQRVRLIYGNEYGVSIKSDGNGTEVRIQFPLKNLL